MPITQAVGQPDLTGNYIARLHAQMLLVEFYKNSVIAQMSTTEYEKQLSTGGNSVLISKLPSITVFDVVAGQDLPVQNPDPGSVELLIDQYKGYNFAVNDIDRKQSDPGKIEKWAGHANKNMVIAVDTSVLEGVYSDASAYNSGATAGFLSGNINLGVSGTPFAVTKANVLDYIISMAVCLDELDVPDDGLRYLTAPAWFRALISTSDLKDASLAGYGKSPLIANSVGMIGTFHILPTNSLKVVTDGSDKCTNMIFGHKAGIAFASQLKDAETLKNPKTFGDLNRAQQAYGFKVIKEEAVGLAYATQG